MRSFRRAAFSFKDETKELSVATEKRKQIVSHSSQDVTTSLDVTKKEELAQHLHNFILKDYLVMANNTLKSLSPDEKKAVVSHRINGRTALFHAVRIGSTQFVDYLLESCQADIEQQCDYCDSESKRIIQGTPLWCAATDEKFNMVKTLIKHGANVNAGTDSTPLRTICFLNNLEIATYLVEHGASVNQPTVHGHTCLMNAVISVELTKFLIDKKASLNKQNKYGYTALHLAVYKNQLETVKLLVHEGADPCIVNSDGDDCLRKAVRQGREEVFNFLIEKVPCTTDRKANLYDILGCHFVDEKQDIPKALELWKTAMKLRYSDTEKTQKKTKEKPNPVYLNMTRAASLEDLEELGKKSVDAVYMQSLMIRERLLGTQDDDVHFAIIYRGAVYADLQQYERAIDLWKYAYKIKHDMEKPLESEIVDMLSRLCVLHYEVFKASHSDYIHLNLVSFGNLIKIIEFAIDEIEILHTEVWIRPVYPKLHDKFDCLIKVLLNMLHLVCLTDRAQEEDTILSKIIKRLVRLNIKASEERSLIHFAVDSNTSEIDDDNYSTFPSLHVIKLLLNDGFFVNETDANRDTPIHVLVQGCLEKPRTVEEMKDFEIIKDYLLSAGAELNAVNDRGETAQQAVQKLFPNLTQS